MVFRQRLAPLRLAPLNRELSLGAREPETVPKKSPSRKRHPCQHHWVCGEAKDQKIPAVCKRCGEETEFSPFVIARNTRKSEVEP